MAAGSSRLCFLWAIALLFVVSAEARADDWKFDVVVLKPGPGVTDDNRVLKGLLLDYREGADEVEIRVIHRAEGEPTRVEPSSFFKRSRIESIEPLDADERAVLERRVRALTQSRDELTRRIRETKLDPIDIDFGKAGKKKGFRYQDEGEHFVLESNVKEEVFRRSVERLALVYNAFTHTLPPHETSGKPTAILLAGTQGDYQALLKERGLNFFNPAFYDAARNQIVCGTDLVRLGEVLEQARQDNQKVADDLAKRKKELEKLYKGKVPPEVMRPIAEGERQLAAARAGNNKLFDDATRVLFQRLYHEAFHAYLANFVYTGERAEMPRWLNEGLAQVFETAIFEGDEVRLGRPDPVRLKSAKKAAGELVPLKDLLRSSPKQFIVAHASDKETSDRYYLTSWALAYYLASDGKVLNTKKLDDYCRATRARDDPLETFLALVGVRGDGLAGFEEKFHAYVRNLQPNGTTKPK
jgi:hypothetical protein